MSLLPIVARELAVAARRPATFRLRATIAVLTSIAAAILLLMADVASGRQGSIFFNVLSVLALAFCLLEGTRTAADSLSEEKREGTLGLLFLTDLRGIDVILGKFAAIAVRSFQGLFAFLPVLAISLILGGVTVGEFWRTAAVLTNALFVAVAVGIWISCLSREAHRALSATFFVLLALVLMPFMVRRLAPIHAGFFSELLLSLSPGAAWMRVSDLSYGADPGAYWTSLAGNQLLGWLCLGAAMAVVPRVWKDNPPSGERSVVSERARHFRFGRPQQRSALRERLLEINPVLWLAARDQGERLLVWAFVGLISGVGVVMAIGAGLWFDWLDMAPKLMVGLAGIGGLGLQLWVAYKASATLAEARRNGTVELLLATPMKVDDMIHGEWLALNRLFFGPLMLLVGVTAAVAVIPWFWGILSGSGWAERTTLMGTMLFQIATLIANLVAAAWVGMWMGLTATKPAIAFGKTVLISIIVPALIFCLPNIFVDLALIHWARSKLRLEFRRAASERMGWEFVPVKSTRRDPPVIRR